MSLLLVRDTAALKRISALARDFVSTHEFIGGILDTLLSWGFARARYYEFVTARNGEEKSLVLSAQAGPHKIRLGSLQIPYEQSTAGKASERHLPIVDCSKNYDPSTAPDWITRLDLWGRSWIDVPLVFGADLVGLLAVDWCGDPLLADEDDLNVLSIVGMSVATALESHPRKLEHEITTHLDELVEDARNVSELLIGAGELICKRMDFGSLCVFDYSWQSDVLTKVSEFTNVPNSTGEYPECYSSHQYLTGKAWAVPEMSGLIADFPSWHAKHRDEIYEPSFTRHTRLFAQLRSVLYCKLDTNEPRFMLRAMNRVDNPELPIVSTQRKLFLSVCQHLSKLVDDRQLKERADHVQSISNRVAKNITRPEVILTEVERALKSEGFNLFVVLCHRTNAKRLTYDFYSESIRQAWKVPNTYPILDGQNWYKKLVDGQTTIVDLRRGTENEPSHSLLPHLIAQGYPFALNVPIKSEFLRGTLLLPFGQETLTPAGFVPKLQRKTFASKLDFLEALASIIGNCIEGRDSHVTSDGARRLLGRIGHEAKAPAHIACEAAKAAIVRMTREITRTGTLTSMLPDLAIYRNRVDEHSRLMERFMKMAGLIAEQESGFVRFHMKATGLPKLIEEAWNMLELSGENFSQDYRGQRKQCEVRIEGATRSLPKLVCDGDYIKLVFLNLFRNAAKYSFSRGNDPIHIGVTGDNAGTEISIQVKNWGIGIRADEMEKIFEPFVRGSAEDPLKRIPGLGLGLYFCRSILRAHGGEIVCQESIREYTDPLPHVKDIGFRNVFKVILPKNLTEGITKVPYRAI